MYAPLALLTALLLASAAAPAQAATGQIESIRLVGQVQTFQVSYVNGTAGPLEAQNTVTILCPQTQWGQSSDFNVSVGGVSQTVTVTCPPLISQYVGSVVGWVSPTGILTQLQVCATHNEATDVVTSLINSFTNQSYAGEDAQRLAFQGTRERMREKMKKTVSRLQTQSVDVPSVPGNSFSSFASGLSIPDPLSNVKNLLQMKMRRDYYQIEWPLTTRKYQYGVYQDGVLQHYFPPAIGIITNVAKLP